MNLRDAFERIMREQREIALATMSEGLPHVRIVNFYYDTEKHCVYFVTFKDNEKVVELAANPSIAFTTVPHNNTTEHVRASGHAVKSARPITAITEITDAIIEKTPRFQETVNAVGADLILYEIKLYEAMVMAARSNWGRIVF